MSRIDQLDGPASTGQAEDGVRARMMGRVRTGDSYDVRTFRSVSDESVYLVSIENETLGVQASGRPSRDPEEAERTAWAAITTAENDL